MLVRQDGTIVQPYAKQVKTLGGGGGGTAAHGGAAAAAAVQQRRQELAAWATANLPSHYKQVRQRRSAFVVPAWKTWTP